MSEFDAPYTELQRQINYLRIWVIIGFLIVFLIEMYLVFV